MFRHSQKLSARERLKQAPLSQQLLALCGWYLRMLPAPLLRHQRRFQPQLRHVHRLPPRRRHSRSLPVTSVLNRTKLRGKLRVHLALPTPVAVHNLSRFVCQHPCSSKTCSSSNTSNTCNPPMLLLHNSYQHNSYSQQLPNSSRSSSHHSSTHTIQHSSCSRIKGRCNSSSRDAHRFSSNNSSR